MEPWKTILCDSEECINKMFVPENMKVSDNSLTSEAIEKFKLYPEIDDEYMTVFKCPDCGKTITWGTTRRKIAKSLYERYQHVRLDSRSPSFK